MPDLGKYAFSVLTSYGISFLLIGCLVAYILYRNYKFELIWKKKIIHERDVKYPNLDVFADCFFIFLVGAFYVGLQRDDDNSLPSVLIGELAPDITKNELYSGSEVTPELMKSPGIKLVNFWASWCLLVGLNMKNYLK